MNDIEIYTGNTYKSIDSPIETYDNQKKQLVKTGIRIAKEDLPAYKYSNDFAKIIKFDEPFVYSGGHIFIEIQFKYNKVLPMVFDAIQIPNKTLSDYYKSYYYNVKENKWKNGNLPYMQFEIDK